LHTQSPYFKAWKLQYLQAFRLYLGGHWHDASKELEKCLFVNPKDGPSIVIKELVEAKLQEANMKAGNANPIWRGYRVLDEK